jgi:hypothetical protein
VIRNTATQDRNNFSIVGEFRGKINDRYKGEEAAEQIGEIGNEIEVIIKYNHF